MLMMCHYPDLCSASDWYIKASFPLGMTNQKALPLGGRGGGYLGRCLLGMCRCPYPNIVYSVTNIIDPILVTCGQICNFCDPNLVTCYFYELTHFLNEMKNTIFFTYSINIISDIFPNC